MGRFGDWIGGVQGSGMHQIKIFSKIVAFWEILRLNKQRVIRKECDPYETLEKRTVRPAGCGAD